MYLSIHIKVLSSLLWILGGNQLSGLFLLSNLGFLYLVFLFLLLLLYIFLVSIKLFTSSLNSISPFAITLFSDCIANPIYLVPKSIPMLTGCLVSPVA